MDKTTRNEDLDFLIRKVSELETVAHTMATNGGHADLRTAEAMMRVCKASLTKMRNFDGSKDI